MSHDERNELRAEREEAGEDDSEEDETPVVIDKADKGEFRGAVDSPSRQLHSSRLGCLECRAGGGPAGWPPWAPGPLRVWGLCVGTGSATLSPQITNTLSSCSAQWRGQRSSPPGPTLAQRLNSAPHENEVPSCSPLYAWTTRASIVAEPKYAWTERPISESPIVLPSTACVRSRASPSTAVEE